MQTVHYFITFYNDYLSTHIGLFCEDRCIDCCTLSNKVASSEIFSACDILFTKNNLTINQCAFIAAHQGPGPFTTLRVILASVNGLAYSTQLPLVGVNGLEALIIEQHNALFDYTVALLNAYCNDVYYALYHEKTGSRQTGCLPFHELQTQLNQLPPSKIQCVGNAVTLYEKDLTTSPSHHTITCKPTLLYASLEAIGATAWHNWCNKKSCSDELAALYLKQSPVYHTVLTNKNV